MLKKFKIGIIFTILLSLFAVGVWLYFVSHTIVLEAGDIQYQVAKKFPLKKSALFTTLILTQPKVLLSDKEDNLRFQLQLTVQLPQFRILISNAVDNVLHGYVDIAGKLRYQQDNHSIYFVEVMVHALRINDISHANMKKINAILNPLVISYFDNHPVFIFKDKDIQQKLAKNILQDIFIKQGKVYIILGH